MRKIYLNIAAILLSIVAAHAQTKSVSNAYKERKLKLEEVNLVSAYYHQDGNNSAVTGGIGTEKLSDIANTIDVQFYKYNKSGKRNTFLFELGVDHYTSASSDKIDPTTISSASSADTRIYPSLNWTQTNEETGNSFGFTGSFSTEFDYQSVGAGFNYTKLSKSRNTQLDFKVQAFLDQWTVILPIELRTGGYTSAPRNSFNAGLVFSQVINPKVQIALAVEPAYQEGLLATKYQRNYFTDGSVKAETLPDNRYKLPFSARLNYFFTDFLVLRSFYRYYFDDWGVRAHTAELEVPIKFSSFFSISPFYRYNNQRGTRYFAPYGQHVLSQNFFTSDYDLSTLTSHFFGAGIHLSPPKGVLGWQRLNMLELRYGHYTRSTGLASDIVSLNMTFK